MKRNRKGSIKALSVANEVIERVRKGKKINMQEIQLKHGYSKQSALAMKATQTATFQYAVAPVIAKMRKLHEKALADLDNRDLSSERMDSVINLSRQMVHDTQLLEGKSTENVAMNIVVYNGDDVLSKQVKPDDDKL